MTSSSVALKLSRRVPPRARKRIVKAVRRVQHQRVFTNWRDYELAGRVVDDGETILCARNGAKIAVRHNRWDTRIVAEQFISRDYLKHVSLPAKPTVLDIGGYIGDFAIYCAQALDANVTVYEPTPENFAMLTKSVALNPGMAERVTAVNKGVSGQPQIVSNVQLIGREVHVSSTLYGNDADVEKRTIDCDSLDEIVANIGHVDLVKIDCEGGEYDILSEVSTATFAAMGALVFEFHPIDGYEPKLEAIEADLRKAGFTLIREGQLEYAIR